MKKLTVILLMICLMASLSCTALADGGAVTGTQPQYLSWETARRAIQTAKLNGGFVQIGDYNLMIWVPENLIEQQELPDDSYIAWFATADRSAEVGVQVMDMGQSFSLEKYEEQLGEQGLHDYGMYVINGFNGLVFANEETDNLSVAFVTGDTEAIYFSFYPASDDNFNQLALVMLASIQPKTLGLSDIAEMMDTDLLVSYWGENRKVTYNESDSSIYIMLWDTGVNSDNIQKINNWQQMKEEKVEFAASYMDSLKELGASDVHLILQYVADEDDAAFLTIVDGEVVYDVFEQQS